MPQGWRAYPGCRVLRVIDGDSLEVFVDLGFGIAMPKEPLRLYGLDAYGKTTEKGRAGTAGMIDRLISPGGEVSLRTYKTTPNTREREKFGRILCQVWQRGVNVGEELVDAGLALPWDGQGLHPTGEGVPVAIPAPRSTPPTFSLDAAAA